MKLEAPNGFEPLFAVLQTAPSPLGYGALSLYRLCVQHELAVEV
jgi:hypothetical protein